MSDNPSPKIKESHRRHAHDDKKKDQSKKTKHAAILTSLPGDLSPLADDFPTRMMNVPGSSPGCTAGAYSAPYTAADAQADYDVGTALSSSLPDIDAAKLRDWYADSSASPLALLACAKKTANVWASVNTYLVKRVRRRDDSAASQRMAGFVCDCLGALRSLPTFPKNTFYRAVPVSAMGFDAPSRDEFGEDCSVVWPVFAALTTDEKVARAQLSGSGGGFLFIVETEHAHDVGSFISGYKSGTEYWLEPNAELLITESRADSDNSSIFIVSCTQNWPSARPIAGELPEKFKKGRKTSRPRSGSTFSIGSDVALPLEREKASPEKATPKLVVRVAPEAAGGVDSSRNEGNGGHLFAGSARNSGRKVGLSGRVKRPTHRVQGPGLGRKGVSMTVWTAVKGNVRVKSVKCRPQDKVIAADDNPAWAHMAERDMEKEKAEEEARQAAEKAEAEARQKEEEELAAKKKRERDHERENERKIYGYNTMSLFPNELPTALVTQEAVDTVIIGAVTADVAYDRAKKGRLIM